MPFCLATGLVCLAVVCGAFASEADKYQAGEVAYEFVKAVGQGNVERLLDLSTDPFNFDGREVAGAERKTEWESFLQRNRSARRIFDRAKLENLDYAEVVKRFGPPPEKFSKLPLKSCIFSVVSLPERTGFLLILRQVEKETWRVAAATD